MQIAFDSGGSTTPTTPTSGYLAPIIQTVLQTMYNLPKLIAASPTTTTFLATHPSTTAVSTLTQYAQPTAQAPSSLAGLSSAQMSNIIGSMSWTDITNRYGSAGMSYLYNMAHPVATSDPHQLMNNPALATALGPTTADPYSPKDPMTGVATSPRPLDQAFAPTPATTDPHQLMNNPTLAGALGPNVVGPTPIAPTDPHQLMNNPALAAALGPNAGSGTITNSPPLGGSVGSGGGVPTPGIPNPFIAASPNQPLPQTGGASPSTPIGNSATPPPYNPIMGQVWSNPNPYTQAQATQMSGVIPGPMAMNHVPYGPELTGLSGYGGLITPNGTPVAMSNWQKQQLDPTSIARYNSYASDIAGMNPADLAQIGEKETGNQMNNFNAPTNFQPWGLTPAPAGG